jgi:hypothetical protein
MKQYFIYFDIKRGIGDTDDSFGYHAKVDNLTDALQDAYKAVQKEFGKVTSKNTYTPVIKIIFTNGDNNG